jgi:hypothetical protein
MASERLASCSSAHLSTAVVIRTGGRLETGPRHQQNYTDCHKENARPVRSEPQESHAAPWRLQSVANRPGGFRAAKLSDPRQIAVRAMYKTPPRTSSAPSPIRNILASQFIAATHNRTGLTAEHILRPRRRASETPFDFRRPRCLRTVQMRTTTPRQGGGLHSRLPT